MIQPNNIVQFPGTNQRTETVPSRKEIDNTLDQNKQYHIQETINFLAPIIFSHLNIAGFTPDEGEENSIKQGAFIVEAIRSYMFAHYELKHPFQKIVEKVFVHEECDGENVWTIARDIKVTLGDKS